jgi:hypothetical protein
MVDLAVPTTTELLMSEKIKIRPGDRAPTSYFQLERARRQLDEPGENEVGDFPKLPPTSPWSSANVIPDEPLVDRREDGDVTGVPTDQHDGGEDA